MTRSALRLFVAVYPPEHVADRLAEFIEGLDLPKHRPVPRPQIHLTLQFIGDVPKSELDDVCESVERSASGLAAFDLTPRALITLPKRGRPRLIAAETDSPPALLEMQRRLAQRFARNARARPGDRFTPHMTLCRFERAAPHVPRVSMEIAVDAFRVDRVQLMRSVLKPTGAEHAEIGAFSLEAAPGG